MRGVFLSMCFMLAAATTLMFVLPAMSRRATAQDNSEAAPLASGAGDAADILNVDGGLQKELASMSPGEREFYVKTSPAAALAFKSMERKRERRKRVVARFKSSPALEMFLNRAVAAKERVILARLSFLEYKREIAYSMAGLPALLLACGTLLALFGSFGPAMFLGTACLRLMTFFLLATSIASLACQITLGLDSFYLSPGFFWIPPACAIVAASVYLRTLDMNYPALNFALRAFTVPFVCSVAAVVWQLAMPSLI
jgi:hypothetical protein